MKKISVLHLLVISLLIVNASIANATWLRSDISKDTVETLLVSFNKRIPEGVVLSKTLFKGIPAYSISYFFYRKLVKTTVLPKTLFLKSYFKFYHIYRASISERTPASVYCLNKIEIQKINQSKDKMTSFICHDDLDKGNKVELGKWYLGLLKYLQGMRA